jgi:ethanolamine utilization protein EutN
MLQGIVIGHATSTLKHPSMTGWRLAIVQPVGCDGQPDTDPLVAVDSLGASPGQRVLINSDGRGSRELVGDDKTPVRFFTVALVDEK